MTDKEKIRAEVKRRKDELHYLPFTDENLGKINAYEFVLKIIDSLPDRIKAEDVIEVPELTELEKKAKKYAIEQVLCTTDTRMTEQAYLSLRIFNGYDVACAYKDGAKNQRKQMINKAEALFYHHMNDVGDVGFCDIKGFLVKFRKAVED